MKFGINKTPPVSITFDIDWAPDWAVEECINICDKYNVPPTFFVTHQSKVVDNISNDEKIELGIHPNFLPNSSHGDTPEEVLAFCRKLVPNAQSMRSHGLMQWTGLYDLVANQFPSVKIDLSLYLDGHKGLCPVHMPVGGGGQNLIRLPYFWEDDFCALSKYSDWSHVPESDGLCIFDFHPVHVCLNMSSIEQYKSLKDSLSDKNLSLANKKDFDPYTNNSERGTKDFLITVLETFQDRGYMSVSNLVKWYDEAID